MNLTERSLQTIRHLIHTHTHTTNNTLKVIKLVKLLSGATTQTAKPEKTSSASRLSRTALKPLNRRQKNYGCVILMAEIDGVRPEERQH